MDIRIKKTWAIHVTGQPSPVVKNLPQPSFIAFVPEKIPFISPRLLVKIGDHVDIGTPLFEDKRRTNLKFLSPAGGSITEITYGHRRLIREIIIAVEPFERHVAFASFETADIAKINQKELVEHLVAGGVWPFLRELPFRKIADPFHPPPAIWVCLDSTDPYQPITESCLNDNLGVFETGLAALKKICNTVRVCQHASSYQKDSKINSYVTHRVSGGYPSNDPGVVVYHTKKSAEENRSWYIEGQDVLMIGRFLISGKHPTERMVAVSRPDANKGFYVRTRTGAPLSHLIPADMVDSQSRWFSGGLFFGSMGSKDSFLGFYDTSVSILPASLNKEFLGFLRPGFDKLSVSRAFLSVFNRSATPKNNDMHGEERACINCGTCAKVCPVDILPQFMYKSIYADEIEESLQHGLLDCVTCGLCSFACPSKIELTESFIAAKHDYCLEQE